MRFSWSYNRIMLRLFHCCCGKTNKSKAYPLPPSLSPLSLSLSFSLCLFFCFFCLIFGVLVCIPFLLFFYPYCFCFVCFREEKWDGVRGGRRLRTFPRTGDVLLPGDSVVRLPDAAASGGGRGYPQVPHRLPSRLVQGVRSPSFFFCFFVM